MNSRTSRHHQPAADQIKRLFANTSLWVKIILPYIVLTMLIAGAGTYVLTNLFTSSLQDRINNQLIDAGSIVSEGIVAFEQERLQTLRAVAATEGVSTAVLNNNPQRLSEIVPQIMLNNDMDVVEIVNDDAVGVYGWQAPDAPQEDATERTGTDWSQTPEVIKVLNGVTDELGDKFTFLTREEEHVIVYTVGPIKENGSVIGAVLIGTQLETMAFDLTLNAVARVTFYDLSGNVLETTLIGGQDAFLADVQADEQFVLEVIRELESQPVLLANPDEETPYHNIDVLGQSYQLAFGEWQLRGRQFGIFSVGVPRNPVEAALQNGRNLFVVIFSIATAGVFLGGLLIAARITKPIRKLVDTATAVTDGNLSQRSGIIGEDEIGQLAVAFDTMTDTLAQRNRTLLEEASKLNAIVDSIADGVIVIDDNNNIVTINPAASILLADMSHDFLQSPIKEVSDSFTLLDGELAHEEVDPNNYTSPKPRKYMLGNRVLSAHAAPVNTPNGDYLGSVVVLRDITREAETDKLKDAFITNVSHELRSPLHIIKLSAELVKNSLNGQADSPFGSVINNLNRGIDDLEHHINQMISISEIQAGTLSLTKLDVDFTDLVQQVADHWEAYSEESNKRFEVVVEDDDLPVNIDVSHLSWAIDNLIENAFNYTAENGTVTLRVYTRDGYSCLDVIDNGIGIAAADQPFLFERFFRAHNLENYAARGVGLGLFITKSIVELHNGFVSAKSNLGVGSTFTISIPLVTERENEPA